MNINFLQGFGDFMAVTSLISKPARVVSIIVSISVGRNKKWDTLCFPMIIIHCVNVVF